MVENYDMSQKPGAMRPINQNILDLYLATTCSGIVQSQDLDYLLSWRQSDNSGDKKLIQHIRAKVASGEIRVLDSSHEPIKLSESQLKFKKVIQRNNPISKSKLVRES